MTDELVTTKSFYEELVHNLQIQIQSVNKTVDAGFKSNDIKSSNGLCAEKNSMVDFMNTEEEQTFNEL